MLRRCRDLGHRLSSKSLLNGLWSDSTTWALLHFLRTPEERTDFQLDIQRCPGTSRLEKSKIGFLMDLSQRDSKRFSPFIFFAIGKCIPRAEQLDVYIFFGNQRRRTDSQSMFRRSGFTQCGPTDRSNSLWPEIVGTGHLCYVLHPNRLDEYGEPNRFHFSYWEGVLTCLTPANPSPTDFPRLGRWIPRRQRYQFQSFEASSFSD